MVPDDPADPVAFWRGVTRLTFHDRRRDPLGSHARRRTTDTGTAMLLERFLCIDFEASGLGPRSYPIEIGLADPVTGAVYAWLIRPHPRWLAEGEWNAESAAIHGITPDQLATEGQDATSVYAAMLPLIAARELVSDNPSYDGRWLKALVAAAVEGAERAGEVVPLLVEFDRMAWRLAIERGRRPDLAWQKADMEAGLRFAHEHRAGPDARRNAEVLRLIAGVA